MTPNGQPRITVADMRGEYWLFERGELSVSIGRGRGGDGAWITNTSDTFCAAPLTLAELAEVYGQYFRILAKSGEKALELHVDGQFQLDEEHLQRIDTFISRLGYSRSSAGEHRWRWTKRTGKSRIRKARSS